jgi:hypothetical protein
LYVWYAWIGWGVWMSRLGDVAFVDWAAEPDHKELAALGQLLTVDAASALPRLMALAERGSTMSMIYIGDSYRCGRGTNVDLEKAENWYRQAADEGSVLGHYDLASLYLTTQRIHQAKGSFEFGARRGYPPALNQLGRMFLSGVGAEKNLEKARAYLERASAAGHIPGKAGLARLLMKRDGSFQTRLRGVLLMVNAQISLWIILSKEGFSSDRLRW